MTRTRADESQQRSSFVACKEMLSLFWSSARRLCHSKEALESVLVIKKKSTTLFKHAHGTALGAKDSDLLWKGQRMAEMVSAWMKFIRPRNEYGDLLSKMIME